MHVYKNCKPPAMEPLYFACPATQKTKPEGCITTIGIAIKEKSPGTVMEDPGVNHKAEAEALETLAKDNTKAATKAKPTTCYIAKRSRGSSWTKTIPIV